MIDVFLATVAALKNKFGLTLFGFDVIIPISRSQQLNQDDRGSESNETKQSNSKFARYQYSQETSSSTAKDFIEGSECAMNEETKPITMLEEKKIMIIDINYFPSYKEVKDFPLRLRRYLRKLSQVNK
jgi:hypothetical protein